MGAGPLTCDLIVQTALQGTVPDDYRGGATGFSYTANVNIPPPVITSITPSSGPQNGGTPVTILGTHLGSVNAVTLTQLVAPLTAVPLLGLTISGGQITGTTQQVLQPGTYSVTATTGTGVSSAPLAYIYLPGIIIE